MKRAATLVLVMLAMSASAAVDARALAREGQKTQWAPTRNFSSLNAHPVFEVRTSAATSPYAGEDFKTAAAAKEAGFTGHRVESALGLSYAKRRWLDSSTGTFLSRDPVGAASRLASPNGLYAWGYAAGNPARFTDPDGRCESSADCEQMSDDLAYLGGRMSEGEVRDRQLARGLGGAVGAPIGICIAVPWCAALMARGALYGLAFDGARQGVKQLEGGQQGFNWEEYASAGSTGLVLGPVSRIPGAGPALMTAGVGLGLQSSWTELKAGNTATAFFDFSTTLYTPARGLQKRLDGSRSFTEFLKLSRSTSALTPEGFEVEIPPEPSRGPSAVATGEQIVLLRNVSTGLDRTKPISASNPDYGSRMGRRGSLETRQDIDRIRDEFLRNNPDYRHVGGGTDQKTGLKVPEEYLRPSAGGRKGGAYADLTFEHRVTRQRIRINTVDVEAAGWMTDREAANFDRIFELTNEPIIALPKPAPPGVQLPQGTSVLP